MAGTMQQFWKHEVPKTTENVGERINLTFRKHREGMATMSQPLAFAVLMIFVAMSSAVTAWDDKTPTFKVTTKRDTDKVDVKFEKDQTVFSVHSPFGISQAVIERTQEKWSEGVVLRLHLNGLENFRASNGQVTLDAAVSSSDDRQRVRLWKDGKEDSPLDSKSPHWMAIRMVGGDGKPAKGIPLKDGFFEMQLPKVFFEDNPKSITVNWIDFYRT